MVVRILKKYNAISIRKINLKHDHPPEYITLPAPNSSKRACDDDMSLGERLESLSDPKKIKGYIQLLEKKLETMKESEIQKEKPSTSTSNTKSIVNSSEEEFHSEEERSKRLEELRKKNKELSKKAKLLQSKSNTEIKINRMIKWLKINNEINLQNILKKNQKIQLTDLDLTRVIRDSFTYKKYDIDLLHEYISEDAMKHIKEKIAVQKLNKTWNCPICENNEDTNEVRCDECFVWIHFQCLGLKSAPTTGKWDMRCIRDNLTRNKCPGKGSLIKGVFYRDEREKYKHNHPKDDTLVKKQTCQQNIDNMAKIPFVEPSQIINYVKSNELVPQSKTFCALRKQVQRSIQANNPVATNIKLSDKNIDEFGKLIEESKSQLQYGNMKKFQLTGKHFHISINKPHGEVVQATNVLIYDSEFIELISPHIENIFVDATFKAFPSLNVHKGQLLTIMAEIKNQKAVPFIWVLMTNKSTECYQQIFQYIADNFENLKPKQSMSDHELAIRKTLKLVFPEIQVRTCYFHYVQAVIKNAQKHKIIDTTIPVHEVPELYLILRRLKYLAILPSNLIIPTFQLIKSKCKENFGTFFDSYLDYYENQWIKSEGPSQFSVYRQTKHRTDNIVESYHKKLNARIKSQTPNHNFFIGVVKSIAEEARINFAEIMENTYEGREKSKTTKERNETMENFWNTIDNHLKNPINHTAEMMLDCIDKIPDVAELKEKEIKNMKKMASNVKTISKPLTISENGLSFFITELDTEESIIKKLMFVHRQSYQYNKDFLFVVNNIN
ncbi:uncharacterized protein LOC123273908 isoform X2 [Cotesia glomerata]|uniref:uncharacterized protein LOC123273908 isoform X2 n=1 Tax=Cotesia glomerata TaxID=32391 RepID=UPI001D031E47|nr:uncharacterized protein LOC123273908 isoform X2 [Cotesia glomerata]